MQKVVDKIEEILPIVRYRAKVYKDLHERDVTSEQDYLEQKLKLIQ
jgi:hypothetical protein